MSVQFVDSGCTAVGVVAGTYNISGTNDQFSLSIDGGSAQVFTLTHGATQTAANVVSDLSGLTGATASVVTLNGSTFVCITDSSSSGNSSTILVNAPSNNANSTLGFIAATYAGGANVSTTFVTSAKQDVASGIEDALNTAGWITVSGHHSIPTVLQSAMSPGNQQLRMRVNLYASTNCLGVTVQNVSGGKAGTQDTSHGGFLLPGTSKTWRIIANKYQAFVFVPGSNNAREYVGFGVPNLPSFLQAGQASPIYEAIWLNGNAETDSDTTARGSFRSSLGWNGSSIGNCTFITNGSIWEMTGSNQGGIGTFTLINMNGNIFQGTNATWYRWHDSSAMLIDPILMWGLTSNSDEGMGRGQLWDCFISNEAYSIDTTLSSIGSHNWWNLTGSNTGTSTTGRGSVFIVTP